MYALKSIRKRMDFWRLKRADKMAHYFTNDDVKSNEKKIEIIFKNKKYIMNTDNGVFSKRGLDFGTRTLLENVPFEKLKGEVLDFGCGYGPIAIIVKDNSNVNVDAVDVNLRSLKLAKKNAELNRLNINFFESNIYSNVTKKYDFIITNPPIRVGKEILYKILVEAKEHLKDNGEVYFVINKDQGAKTVAKYLENYYLVTIVDKNKGFYIINLKNKKI